MAIIGPEAFFGSKALLAHSDPLVREAAVLALENIHFNCVSTANGMNCAFGYVGGKKMAIRTIPKIRKALDIAAQDTDDQVRLTATRVSLLIDAGESRSGQDLPPIPISSLIESEDVVVRRAALQALAICGDRRDERFGVFEPVALAVLRTALEDDESAVRHDAVRAIIIELSSRHGDSLDLAKTVLGNMVPLLIEFIDSARTTPTERSMAHRALTRTPGEYRVAFLIELLKHPDPNVYASSVSTLFRSQQDAPPIILQHQDALVQHIDDLDLVFREDRDQRAVLAIVAMGWAGPQGIARLNKNLQELDSTLRLHLMKCLRAGNSYADRRFYSLFLEAMRFEDVRLHEIALPVLGKFSHCGYEGAVRDIELAASDSNERVSIAAQLALTHIRADAENAFRLRSDLLMHDSHKIRMYAVSAIGTSNRPLDSIRPLLVNVRDSDSDPRVREVAERTLARVDSR